MANGSGGAQPAQQSAYQANLQIRNGILANAVPVLQNIKSGSITNYAAGSPSQVTTLLSNTGFIRRVFLEITATVNCGASHTATPTFFGPANLLSNVTFTDQNNRQRINTTGLHLHLRASEHKRRSFGGALVASTGISDPSGVGANFPVMNSTGAVSGGTAKTFTWIYEIPIVNSNQDLTGGIYANQTTSNNQLQFTINPAFFEYNGDPFNSAYSMDAALATSAPTLTSINWTLYQDFLDDLPVYTSGAQQGYAILPQLDVSWSLNLFMLNPGAQVQGQDNLYALQPFNTYTNIMAFWDNYTYNGAVGGDVTTLYVKISNSYILRQWDPLILASLTRNLLGTDMPGNVSSAATSGAIYNMDFRSKPLSVDQLSATNIIFHPSTVETAASLMYGVEYLWFANQSPTG